MDGMEIYEALGVEPEEENPDPEQPPEETDPTPETGGDNPEENTPEDEGNGGEGEEPPADDGQEQPPEGGEAQPPEGEDKPKPQSREEMLAEARRIAQAEKAREMDEFVKGLNLIDPATKKPVTTVAEYNEYKARINSEARERILKKAGLSEEKFKEFVNSQPEVSEARAAAQAAQRERAKAAIDEQVRQIHEIDPTINEFADLGKMENFKQFYDLARNHHLSLVDAYKLVNMDKLTQRRIDAERQAARNAAASKAHLQKQKPRGGGAADVPVPADVAEFYRELVPGISNADMQRDYSRYAAKQKKGV